MRHGHATVVFTECNASNGCDSIFRHEFANEDDASLPLVPHVEAKVHLFKRAVKWNRDSREAGVLELEAHKARIGFAVELIELRACGNERLEQRRVDGVVEHKEMAPVGGEERSLLRHHLHNFKTHTAGLTLQILFSEKGR